MFPCTLPGGRRGKRFKKLASILGSASVQRAARDFHWQALLANVAQVLSNLVSFILLTLLLHAQVGNRGRVERGEWLCLRWCQV